MINNTEILNYIKTHYGKEHKLITRSMINYYTLKLDTTNPQVSTQKKLLKGVVEIIEILSILVAPHFDVDSGVILELLKDIHIGDELKK